MQWYLKAIGECGGREYLKHSWEVSIQLSRTLLQAILSKLLICWVPSQLSLLPSVGRMNEWGEFVFAPSYRDLSRGCCVSIICLLVQFSFKSAAETSECKGQVEDSQWQRVPDRRAGSGEAAWSISRQSTAWNCQIVTGSRMEMLTTSCRRHRVHMSATYDGAIRWRHLNTSVPSLYWMRCHTGSQWRLCNMPHDIWILNSS